MHGESSSDYGFDDVEGDGGHNEQTDIVLFDFAMSTDEFFDIMKQAEEEGEVGGKDGQDRRGQRVDREGKGARSRRSARIRRDRLADLNGYEDLGLSAEKVLMNFHVLPISEVHASA